MTTSGAYGSHEIHEIKLTENKNRNGRTVDFADTWDHRRTQFDVMRGDSLVWDTQSDVSHLLVTYQPHFSQHRSG